ncbi:MAG: rhodanese-like domain-containing protein, partial [Candidatus Woesearchaeota archaeon]|nr:rhodanese-like domain-containing protein [Candidatus Woesearchaeota archaeon]
KMKKEGKNQSNTVLLAIVVGVLAGGVTAYLVVNSQLNQPKTQDELIKEFYDVETAVHVSPHGMRKHLGENPNQVIVDLRSQEEYQTAHITTAISIPAYATPDKSDYGAVARIVGGFEKILEENPKADIIVYCYSGPCMTGRKIGHMLADHGIYVRHLGIGWSEWKYYWNMWNHDGETQVNPEEFITSGPEPGTLSDDLLGTGCPIGGEFGC